MVRILTTNVTKLKIKNIEADSVREGFLILKSVTRIPASKYPAIRSLIKEEVKRNCNQLLLRIRTIKNRQIKALFFLEVFNSDNNSKFNQKNKNELLIKKLYFSRPKDILKSNASM